MLEVCRYILVCGHVAVNVQRGRCCGLTAQLLGHLFEMIFVYVDIRKEHVDEAGFVTCPVAENVEE